MTEKSQLQVEAICNGSVIDHIPAGQGINILKRFAMLDTRATNRITVGFNLPSGALGSKDLIKIENKQLTQTQVNQLALLAPSATVNIIENFEVVKKYRVELPNVIEGVYRCPNTNCISNYEPAVKTSFFIQKTKNNDIKLKCKYCEKAFDKQTVGQTLEKLAK